MSRVRAPSVTPIETVGHCARPFLVNTAYAKLGRMPQTLERVEVEEHTILDTPWVAVVWNDPVNLMTYVAYVFRSYFGFSAEKAEELMLQVHNNGRAVVATGSREEVERHTEAMHDFGLWATVQKDGT